MTWKKLKDEKPERNGEYLVYDGVMTRVDTWYKGCFVDTTAEMNPIRFWLAFPDPPNTVRIKKGATPGPSELLARNALKYIQNL